MVVSTSGLQLCIRVFFIQSLDGVFLLLGAHFLVGSNLARILCLI